MIPRNLPYPPTTPFHRAMWLLRPCECRHFYQPAIWWKFFEVKRVMLEIVRETSLPQQKTGQVLTSPKVKNNEFTPERHGAYWKTGRLPFLLQQKNTSTARQFWGGKKCDAPRLRRPGYHQYGTPKKDVGGWKILGWVAHIFVQKLGPYRHRGVFEFGNRVSKLLKGVSLHLQQTT